MLAIVIHSAGDLRLEEQDCPPPLPGEVQVQIVTGGVCGSDLHYYNHGGFGTVRLKQPMILGHEVAGIITMLGEGVGENAGGKPDNSGSASMAGLCEGDLVAISPSRPCGNCRYCAKAMFNHCLNMRFYGSAMPWPHIQGAFRQTINALATQCVPAKGLTPALAAMAEPFSVVLHACKRAGNLLGKRVLITGCGPIGVLAVTAARRAGAVEIVATDLADNALQHAAAAGADRVINSQQGSIEALAQYSSEKGYFDVMFECSGAVSALTSGIAAMAPGGIIMQLGLGGDMSVPMMELTAKELQLRGSFRFHEEFATAVSLMQSGLVDLQPLITHSLPLQQAEQAFKIANDRSQAMKTQINFTE